MEIAVVSKKRPTVRRDGNNKVSSTGAVIIAISPLGD